MSTIDTTILVAGALTAAAYFDQEADDERDVGCLPTRCTGAWIGGGHKTVRQRFHMGGSQRPAFFEIAGRAARFHLRGDDRVSMAAVQVAEAREGSDLSEAVLAVPAPARGPARVLPGRSDRQPSPLVRTSAFVAHTAIEKTSASQEVRGSNQCCFAAK
jgi:hypothetical protein